MQENNIVLKVAEGCGVTRKELCMDMLYVRYFVHRLVISSFKDDTPTGEVIHHSLHKEHTKYTSLMHVLWFIEAVLWCLL
jgi:hypothetical protein